MGPGELVVAKKNILSHPTGRVSRGEIGVVVGPPDGTRLPILWACSLVPLGTPIDSIELFDDSDRWTV